MTAIAAVVTIILILQTTKTRSKAYKRSLILQLLQKQLHCAKHKSLPGSLFKSPLYRSRMNDWKKQWKTRDVIHAFQVFLDGNFHHQTINLMHQSRIKLCYSELNLFSSSYLNSIAKLIQHFSVEIRRQASLHRQISVHRKKVFYWVQWKKNGDTKSISWRWWLEIMILMWMFSIFLTETSLLSNSQLNSTYCNRQKQEEQISCQMRSVKSLHFQVEGFCLREEWSGESIKTSDLCFALMHLNSLILCFFIVILLIHVLMMVLVVFYLKSQYDNIDKDHVSKPMTETNNV